MTLLARICHKMLLMQTVPWLYLPFQKKPCLLSLISCCRLNATSTNPCVPLTLQTEFLDQWCGKGLLKSVFLKTVVCWSAHRWQSSSAMFAEWWTLSVCWEVPNGSFLCVFFLNVWVFIQRIAQMGRPRDILLMKILQFKWAFFFSGRWLLVIS